MPIEADLEAFSPDRAAAPACVAGSRKANELFKHSCVYTHVRVCHTIDVCRKKHIPRGRSQIDPHAN